MTPLLDAAAMRREVKDKQDVGETIVRYMTMVDLRRWAEVRTCFAELVYIDYTALRPDPPAQTMPADEIVTMWKRRHDPISACQHHMGNLVPSVEGDRAHCLANGIGIRYENSGTAGTLTELGAYYEYGLVRDGESWKIDKVKIDRLWEKTLYSELFWA